MATQAVANSSSEGATASCAFARIASPRISERRRTSLLFYSGRERRKEARRRRQRAAWEELDRDLVAAPSAGPPIDAAAPKGCAARAAQLNKAASTRCTQLSPQCRAGKDVRPLLRATPASAGADSAWLRRPACPGGAPGSASPPSLSSGRRDAAQRRRRRKGRPREKSRAFRRDRCHLTTRRKKGKLHDALSSSPPVPRLAG